MKKLLVILQFFCLTLTVNAQQTEDEVHVGSYPKGKTFGNYNGPDTKPFKDQVTVKGIVIDGGLVSVGQDTLTDRRGGLYSFVIKKDDGVVMTVETKDHRFTVPREIIGHTIIAEGIDNVSYPRRRKTLDNENEKNSQIAATGIMVIE